MGTKFKYFTKETLEKANNRAIAKNYNRALDPEFVANLPEDLNFPVIFTLTHEHAAGKPVEPHMRCHVMTGASLFGPFTNVFVDVEMGMYEMLPDAESPAEDEPENKSDKIAKFSLN